MDKDVSGMMDERMKHLLLEEEWVFRNLLALGVGLKTCTHAVVGRRVRHIKTDMRVRSY